MSIKPLPWSIEAHTATYEVVHTAEDRAEERMAALRALGLLRFEALSIGTYRDGQAAIVPLDESNRETAEFIVRACNAHDELLATLRNLVDSEVQNLTATQRLALLTAARIAIARWEEKT